MSRGVTFCDSIMAKLMVRLDKDVSVLVKKAAETNSRSIPKEVNRILREVLAKGAK